MQTITRELERQMKTVHCPQVLELNKKEYVLEENDNMKSNEE